MRLLPNTAYTIGLEYMVTDVPANEKALAGGTAFIIGVKSEKAEAAFDTANALIAQFTCKAEDGGRHSTGALSFTTGNYDDYYIDLLDETYTQEFIIDNFCVDQR